MDLCVCNEVCCHISKYVRTGNSLLYKGLFYPEQFARRIIKMSVFQVTDRPN